LLKKCGYNKPLSKRPFALYHGETQQKARITLRQLKMSSPKLPKGGLFQEEHMKESNFYDFEEHSPVISNIIINRPYLPNFQEAMEGQEVIILDNIDHPDCDMDYELTGELELCERGIITGSDLFSFVKNNVHYFKSFRFDDDSINSLTHLID
jgi:hypothetical protein